MDRLFLIIGPSGVGKSSAIDKIDLCDGLAKYNLDAVIKEGNGQASIPKYFEQIGNEGFFRKSIDAIERLKKENSSAIVLIDVGAGSFDWEDCVEDFLKYQIISLTGDKKVLYSRISNRDSENRSFDEYVSSEFKKHKIDLYDNANFTIDTTHLDSTTIATKIKNIIFNVQPLTNK